MAARRVAWVVLAVACLVTVAGCGSESTGRTSAEAVQRTAREFGGPDVKLYVSQVTIRSAADGQWRHIAVITACRPDGACTLIAPDGVSYPDVQSFVDDNKAVEPGDVVLANPNMTSPDAPTRLEEFRKSTGPPWVWIAGGAAAAVVVLLPVGWLVRRRRRRIADRDLLRAWEAPENG